MLTLPASFNSNDMHSMNAAEWGVSRACAKNCMVVWVYACDFPQPELLDMVHPDVRALILRNCMPGNCSIVVGEN